MRFSSININGEELAAAVMSEGLITIRDINSVFDKKWKEDMFALICEGHVQEMCQWSKEEGDNIIDRLRSKLVPFEKVIYAPLYRNPQRIFGIGLNYSEHAADLLASAPDEFPGCFYKPASSIVGYNDWIKIPNIPLASKTTGEAELGIIIGKNSSCVEMEEWESQIVGYTTILDMTEESILRRNPRFLTMAKCFNTFLALGPQLITPDEIGDISKLKIQTVHNDKVYASNVVAAMRHSPSKLISLVSKTQGWLAGDVLLTGTPRAVEINDGDIIECRIIGENGFEFMPLKNPVIDLKLS